MGLASAPHPISHLPDETASPQHLAQSLSADRRQCWAQNTLWVRTVGSGEKPQSTSQGGSTGVNAFQTGDMFYSDRAFSVASTELTAITMHTYSAHVSQTLYCMAEEGQCIRMLYSVPSHCLPVTQSFRLHFLLKICKHGYYILFVTFKFLFIELTYLVLLFETGSYCISRTGLDLTG